MMHTARLLSRAAFILVACSAATAAQDVLVAPLKNQAIIEGCAWSASAPALGKGFIFLAELDDSVVRMNIGGIDVDLKLTSQSGKLDKRGDVHRKIYRADGVEVVATYTVTWDCSQSDNEDCEVTKYDVTFEVKKGASTQAIKATGDAGC